MEIKINKSIEGFFNVETETQIAEKLNYDEMLGLVATFFANNLSISPTRYFKNKNKKWKPKNNEHFYQIGDLGGVWDVIWNDDNIRHQSLYNAGNCFRTKEEAQEVANKFKNLLNK